MVRHLANAGLHLSDVEHALRLSDDYECLYLVTHSGEYVGAIKYRELPDRFEIMQLQIHPESQRKGIGKAVMERILDCSKKGHKKLHSKS